MALLDDEDEHRLRSSMGVLKAAPKVCTQPAHEEISREIKVLGSTDEPGANILHNIESHGSLADSRNSSFNSFPGTSASRLGFNARGVGWDNRWVVLIAALWIQCNSGLHYSFSMYSNDLKNVLHYTQQQTDGLGSAKDLGASLGIISGIVFDRYGPRKTLFVGAALNLCGYFVVWLAVTSSVPITLSYWQMCLTIAVACNGQTWYDTTAVVSSLRNFPDDRGTVAGLVKCFVGLSAAIYTQVYIGLFAPKVDRFVLLIAILPSLFGLAVMGIIKLVPSKTYEGESADDKAERFKLAKILVVVLGLYLLGVTGFQTQWKAEQHVSFILMVVMLAILAMPALIPFRTCIPACIPDLTSPPLSPTTPGLSNESPLLPHWRESDKNAEKKANLTLGQALKTVNFWLLFYVAMCSIGSGLTVINNLAQIVTALGGSAPVACLSLISVANCLGRLAAGCWSEELLHKYGVPRPYFLLAASSVMCVAQVLIAYANLGALYSCVLLVGFSYGCHLSLLPTITSELFGLTHFGTLYNFFGLSMAAGSFLLSTCLAGYFYDHNSDANSTEPCKGPHCFRSTFLICSCVCASAAFASLILVKRSKKSYRSEYRRLKHK